VPTAVPDPEFAWTFRAYAHHLQALADVISSEYGPPDGLAAAVHRRVLLQPFVRTVQRRQLCSDERAALDQALRKAWGRLRRVRHHVEDADDYDEEANAWLPVETYYAVYHAIVAFGIATGQVPPRDHAAALKLVAKEVRRGLLPHPWSIWCEGCPQTGTVMVHGTARPSELVHVPSSPGSAAGDERLVTFLRTTRQKELERRFADSRTRNVPPGRTRRRLTRQEKESAAGTMAPTTIFDLLWRLRKKASYDDPDCFVFGAVDEVDARRFGEALAIIADATVAALEGAMTAYVGLPVVADLARSYADRTGSAWARGRLIHGFGPTGHLLTGSRGGEW
jgi:hypothetical protein